MLMRFLTQLSVFHLIYCTEINNEDDSYHSNEDVCKPAQGPAKMGYVISQIGDVNNLTQRDAKFILSSIVEHGVVVIRNQTLTRQQQVDFTSKLGEIIVLPLSFEGKDPEVGFPAIQRATNYWHNGTWKGKTHCFGCYWHKDGDFQENGYLLSMLYADDVAENRSTTNFVDTCETVSRKLSKSALEELSEIVYTVSVRSIPDFANGTEEDYSLYPLVKRHRVVYLHRGNGRKCVYVDVYMVTEQGHSPEYLSQVLEEVVGRGEKYVHYWRRGDIVIWDNEAVMHRAGTRGVSGPNDKTPRILLRTQAWL